MEKLVSDTERFAASLLVLLQERGLVPNAQALNAEESDAGDAS
jgi:hypothetical protein